MMREGIVSEYGTQTHSRRSTSGETINCRDINIPSKLIGILLKHGGTFWRSGNRTIVNIPSEEWADYIEGKMDLESAHNFKQLAWVQLSQFYLQDVCSAIEEFTLCEELGQSVEEYGKYLEKNRNRINFIRLVAETKVYALLEQWNREEIKKEKYMEDQEKLVVPDLVKCDESDSSGEENCEEWVQCERPMECLDID
jgi:hypothetical protein